MLEWQAYGDPEGVPVVLQPGTPGTARVAELAHESARIAGVRLVAISRPGYGTSPVTPPGLASVAEQVAKLADELELHRFAVWGWSGGGPYALAQAAVTPARVTRVAVSAGPFDGWPVEDEDALTEEISAAAAAFALMDDAAMTAAMKEQAPPGEEDYFDTHPGRPVFLADFRRAISRPDGYVRDNLTWEGAWDVSVEHIPVTVDLIYGESDRMVTLDNGERLAAALPHAHLHVVPGGHGHATFGSADVALSLLVGPR